MEEVAHPTKMARLEDGSPSATAAVVDQAVRERKKNRMCAHSGCTTTPHFNYTGKKTGLYCGHHRLPSMLSVTKTSCAHSGCEKQPVFNNPTEKMGLFCRAHRHQDMVNVVSRKCAHTDCDKTPAFNKPDKKKGLLCRIHAHSDMINVLVRRCAHANCSVYPSFNHPGVRRGGYCGQHKQLGMICVTRPPCAHADCHKYPSYNHRGENTGLFCKNHAHDGMVNVVTRKCAHAGCDKVPLFNRPGEIRGLLCGDHRHHDMVNVRHRTCAHANCPKVAFFNRPGEKMGLYCADHRENDMINIWKRTCAEAACTTLPSYGLPGHRATHCAQHVHEGMIHKPFTKCMEGRCKEPAIYGVKRALHCALHTIPGENNLIGRACVRCGLIDVVDAQGRCKDCDPDSFKRHRLAKQREVKLMLEAADHGDFVLYDRIIDSGNCGKERPDFMWDCGTHRLILEVDEDNGHKTREELCECTRMVNISQSNGMPTVFLRYNPDSFKVNGKARNVSMLKRRATLMRWVTYLKRTAPQYFLGVLQIFFDEYKEGSEQMYCILGFHEQVE